jgi:hypothetical protein
VIGVRNQDRVDGAGWQLRMGDLAEGDVEVGMTAGERSDPQKSQRLPAQVDRNHAPIRAYAWRDLERKVPGARAEIDDSHPVGQLEMSNYIVRTLPCVPLTLDVRKGTERATGLVGNVHCRNHDEDNHHGSDNSCDLSRTCGRDVASL